MADMKEQQKILINHSRRRAFAWVACFALLFGMLAMPMTPTMPRTQGEEVVWGSFCTGQGVRLVATAIPSTHSQTPERNDHALMQHCPCCSGSLSMVAIPAGNQPGFFAFVLPVRLTEPVLMFNAPTRVLWPSVNPRASPRV